MAGIVFDAVYNSEGVMRGVRESQRAFAELRSSAENEGIRIDNAFKKQIYEGSQSVNTLTGKIIDQKKTVRSLTKDIDTLTEAYKKVSPDSVKGKDLFASLTNAKSMLKNKKDELFELQTQQAQVRLSVRKLKDEYSLYQKEGQNVVESNNQMALSFKKTLAAVGGTAMIQKFVSDVVRVRGQFQQLDVAFTTLLQSKEKANALMAQMVQTAAKTPFNLTELATGAKQLVAYGFASEGVNETLVRLGNIASGLGLPLERLTYLYGTTMTQGRLYARDLMQFTTSGIPMLQGLADMYGVSTDKVNEMVTAGKIGFPEVQKVIENMTNEGGEFFNLMEEQSKTITGKISNLGDAWDSMLNKIGESQEGTINASIDGLKYLIENYEQVGSCVAGLVGIYGTYRTALIFNAMLEQGFTKAIWAKVTATKAATLAQATYNKILALNPLVTIGAAVVSLGIAMWTLHDSTTAAEKAQKRFNDSLAVQKQQLDDLKNGTIDLINTIKSETSTQYDKEKALVALQKMMPTIFKNMDIEKLKLMDILSLNKQIAEEINRRERIGAQTNLVMATNKYNKATSEYNRKKNMGLAATNALGEKNDAYLEMELAQKQVDKILGIQKKAKDSLKPKELKIVSLQSNIDTLKSEISEMQSLVDKEKKESGGWSPSSAILNAKKGQLSTKEKEMNTLVGAGIKSEKKEASEWLSSYKKAYNDAEKAYNDFLKSKQVMSDADRDKELKRLKEDRDAAKATYESKGGSTSSDTKQESASEKLRKQNDKLKELSSKQSIEQSRAEEDLQNQVDQSRISSMKEGSEKILAQMELDHEKELQVIDRQMEDLLLKKKSDAKSSFEANPANQGKSFDDSNVILSDSELKQFDSLYKALLGKQSTDTDVFYKSVTDKYQDYTTQRLAIEKQFNADIAILQEERKRAQESGDTGKVETTDRAIAQATTDKGKSLMGLDYDKLKESPEYVRAFENLKETSSETLNSLLTQLENAKTAAAQVLSPDQLREYTTTIQEIMDELDARNPFQALADRKKELAEAEEELAEAKSNLDKVNSGGKVASGTKFNEKTGKIDTTYLSATQALEKYNKAKDKSVKADAKVKKAEKDVKGQIDELSNAISDLGSAVGGQAGEIISLIGEIGSFAMFAMEGVKAAADTSATAISNVEKASVILAIIGAAIQIATKIAKLFSGDDEEKRKKYIEHLNGIIDIYDKIIEKQKESIKFGYGFSSIVAAKKAMEDLNKQTEQYRKIASVNPSIVGGDNAKQYMQVMKESGIDVQELIFGKVQTRQLYKLSSKQLEYIRDNYKDLWASLKDEQREALQAIIDSEEKGKEIIDAWQESITGISYDSFYLEFIDTLSDMDSSAEDMAENFGEYLKKSILAAMVAKEFQGEIDNLYEMWVTAGKEKSDGGIDITEDEAKKIQERQKELAEAMIKRREEMAKTYGWDTPSSQDSTKGGFEAMSQDTGTELNGRFTALQISNEEIKNSMLSMLIGVNLISTTNTANGITLMEIRNIALMSNSHLEDIARFTKPLLEVGGKLDRIESNTKGLASR